MSYTLLNYEFQLVCNIMPELGNNGVPIEYNPQSKYLNYRHLPLHAYGKGPFCRFGIPNFLHKTGVYVVLVNEQPRYVVECEDLAKRWNMGYGNISPRNCFKGGQPTNCRINNLILASYKSNSEIKLLFHPTNNRFEIESLLIQELVPAWNRSRGKASGWVDVKDGGRGVSKYDKLGKYLANSNRRLEELTYDTMEKIVGVKLPHSAYHYRPWWANSGQSHSKT
jgi:hypothetical protein